MTRTRRGPGRPTLGGVVSTQQRYRQPRAAHLLAASSGCLLALGLTYAWFVRTGAGQQLDQRFLARPWRGEQTVLFGAARSVLAVLGDPLVLAALLASVVVVAALSGRTWAGVAGIVVVGGSIAAARVLKLVMPRPDLGVAGSTTHNSFPSGHVAAATGLVLAVLLALPAGARRWCAVPGAACVCAVTAATMIAGWHRLSDAVGGVLLAAALCCLVVAFRSRKWTATGQPGNVV